MRTAPLRISLASLLTFTTLLLALPAPRAWADDCVPPQLLIVLDKSSSMNNVPSGSSDSLWTIAGNAIGTLTNNYEASIDLGLMLFPYPNQCSPGAVVVEMGPNNSSAITTALGPAPPAGGNWTPMAQSLSAAADHGPLLNPAKRNFLVLITDGWQWCDPYDSATRFLPVQSVANLKTLGVTVFVVGFSGSVDSLTLNRAAVAAGTNPPGCDETSSDPANPNNCYFQADNLAQLSAVLDQIGVQITQEICDGIDNNCNGEIDENLSRSCHTICGEGVETCTMGVWGGCTAPEPEEEICDGIDNDCDGEIDEGCDCVDGDIMPCGKNVGACTMGRQICEDGLWSACQNAVRPTPEICDGIDNDCNGLVDDGLKRPCETLCGEGEEICINGEWMGCTASLPTGEICDGLDNDCDGEIDEGALCGLGFVCENGACVPDGTGTPDAGPQGATAAPDACGCAATDNRFGAFGMMILILLSLLAIRRRQ